MKDIYIIPCGAAKLDTPAAAADLYTSSTFKMALQAALAQVDGDRDSVLILSALHGLIDLDTIIEPYDVKMGDDGAIDSRPGLLACQLLDRDLLDANVWSFLPRSYFDALDVEAKSLGIWMAEGFEATGGIGDQRRVLSLAA